MLVLVSDTTMERFHQPKPFEKYCNSLGRSVQERVRFRIMRKCGLSDTWGSGTKPQFLFPVNARSFKPEIPTSDLQSFVNVHVSIRPTDMATNNLQTVVSVRSVLTVALVGSMMNLLF